MTILALDTWLSVVLIGIYGTGPGTPSIPCIERDNKTSGSDSRTSCKEASCFNSPCNMVDCEVSSPNSWKECQTLSGCHSCLSETDPTELWGKILTNHS